MSVEELRPFTMNNTRQEEEEEENTTTISRTNQQTNETAMSVAHSFAYNVVAARERITQVNRKKE